MTTLEPEAKCMYPNCYSSANPLTGYCKKHRKQNIETVIENITVHTPTLQKRVAGMGPHVAELRLLLDNNAITTQEYIECINNLRSEIELDPI